MARLEVLNKVYIGALCGAILTLKNIDTGKVIDSVRSTEIPIGMDDYERINIGDILTGSRGESFIDIYNRRIFVHQIGNDNVNINLCSMCTNDELARISKDKLTWKMGFPADKFMNVDGIVVEKFNKMKSTFPLCVFRAFPRNCVFTMTMETGKVKVFENAVKQVEKYYNKL